MKGIKRKPLLVASLVLVLSLVLSSGCIFPQEWFVSPPSESPPAVAPTPTPVTPTPPAVNPGPIDSDGNLPPPQASASWLPDFVAVVEKVKPSVVAIQTDIAAGSGWIIREDGVIVTNNHVVEGAQNIGVALDDGRTFSAKAVYADPFTDLAVVEIDAQGLPTAAVGDSSKLRLGEPVCAIGNALGEGISMTGGWVSQLGVSLTTAPGQTQKDLIRTDAAINPGNSGGPLVNMAGEVVGITSIKIAQVGIEGFGYAISINSARDIISQLVNQRYVVRSYLGASYQTVNPIFAFFYNLAISQGAMVTEVEPGSPADIAGLKRGDVIVSLDGEEIISAGELDSKIYARQIGQVVEIVYWRGNAQRTTQATLTETPPP